MSRTSRNFVVAYIFLVGLPLLGLVGVLRSGRHLVAPISVDGSWRFDADAKSDGEIACGSVSTLLNSPLVISQSGRKLEVSFKGTAVAPGLLEDKNLKWSMPVGSESNGACGSGSVTVAAVVDPKSEPRSMTGQLSFAGCASCAPLHFRAVRQPKSQAGGGH
jgi:hypothetical protein